MQKEIEALTTHPVFYHFAEISKIPRGSGNEQEISDYLVQFARDRNLEVIQDEALNVIIKKAASPRYEQAPTVIIQGHMDMVCEKNQGTVHDFERDPIQLKIVDDFLYARDTTLGADNGIAIAYALALLDADDLLHPALEIVMTTEEETTMNGALAIDPTHFEGKVYINLDSGEDGKLLVSSAGGVHVTQVLPIEWVEGSNEAVVYAVRVKGLRGGHSGVSIDEERGNANKLLGRVLQDLSSSCHFELQSMNGGLKSNAIPREAEAILRIGRNDIDLVNNVLERWQAVFKNEYQLSDATVAIVGAQIESTTTKVFSEETKKRAITSLILIPNGIQGMSKGIEGLVESSTNLGVIATTDQEMSFENEIRSSVKSKKAAIVTEVKTIAELLGCEVLIDGEYPEWPYEPQSNMRNLFETTYREKYGEEIEVIAVHAGVECGVFSEKIPGLDAVSIGPDMYQLHTPEEHLSISSTINNWSYFTYTLERMRDYFLEE